MAYPFGGGGRAIPGYRGSRRRMRRTRVRDSSPVVVWTLLVLALLFGFVVIPWLARHPPPPHHDHVFGASDAPDR